MDYSFNYFKIVLKILHDKLQIQKILFTKKSELYTIVELSE